MRGNFRKTGGKHRAKATYSHATVVVQRCKKAVNGQPQKYYLQKTKENKKKKKKKKNVGGKSTKISAIADKKKGHQKTHRTF